ncbi:MAG: hypothetical protein Q9213_005679 [Squamulea squamosa]
MYMQMPRNVTKNTSPPISPSSLDTEVTWPSILWALLPIAFNSMTQPAGAIASRITAEQSFYLRASPFVCIVEASAVLIQFVCLAIKVRNPYLATSCLSKARLQTLTIPGTPRTQLQNLQENNLFRAILFVLGVLPQAIKLFASSGIPASRAWASLYLVSWTVLEILVVMPGRYGALERPACPSALRVFINFVDNLVELICYFIIHFCDFMALHLMYVEIDKERQIHNPPTSWRDYLAGYSMGAFYILLLAVRPSHPGPAICETITYLMYLYVLVDFGVAESFWLVSLRLGRFVSVIGIGGPVEEDQPDQPLKSTSTLTEYTLIGSIAFFLMQILTAVGSYKIMFDPAETSKPAWTEYLG